MNTRMFKTAMRNPRMRRQELVSKKNSKKENPFKKRSPSDIGELMLIWEIKENLNTIAQIKSKT